MQSFEKFLKKENIHVSPPTTFLQNFFIKSYTPPYDKIRNICSAFLARLIAVYNNLLSYVFSMLINNLCSAVSP